MSIQLIAQTRCISLSGNNPDLIRVAYQATILSYIIVMYRDYCIRGETSPRPTSLSTVQAERVDYYSSRPSRAAKLHLDQTE